MLRHKLIGPALWTMGLGLPLCMAILTGVYWRLPSSPEMILDEYNGSTLSQYISENSQVILMLQLPDGTIRHGFIRCIGPLKPGEVRLDGNTNEVYWAHPQYSNRYNSGRIPMEKVGNDSRPEGLKYSKHIGLWTGSIMSACLLAVIGSIALSSWLGTANQPSSPRQEY